MNTIFTWIDALKTRNDRRRWLREQRRHRYRPLDQPDWIRRDINPEGISHSVPGDPRPRSPRRQRRHRVPVFIQHRGVPA